MNIGILQTGLTPESLQPAFGRYDAMVGRMLGEGYRTTTFDVVSGILPARIEDHDAYVITGSSAGVYDPLPWIEPLKTFLRDAEGRAKIVGICFGHQIMAEAFGGRVEKSLKGWGMGLHRYDLSGDAAWMDGPRHVSVVASHQDQVTVPPPDAEILGASDFTPFAILGYPARRAISFQFHPEFGTDFAEALVDVCRPRLGSPAQADAAIASLRRPHDAARVAGWIRSFLQSA